MPFRVWKTELSGASRISYVWSKRINGQMRRGRLTTTGRPGRENRGDAVREFRALFADIERGEVAIGDRTISVRQLVESFPIARYGGRRHLRA